MSATFGSWVAATFDHEPGKPEWYWGEDFDAYWASLGLSDDLTVAYLARLFREPWQLKRYSLDQVADGIWFLIGESSPAQPSYALLRPAVPLDARAGCVRAMAHFFEAFVAPAAPGPADTESNPFHIACYMWWDIFPSWGGPRAGEPAIHDACLDVMAEVLRLQSELCRLSALHGLNHWHLHHPGTVEKLVDAFLGSARYVTPRIRDYAALAREGGAQ